MQEVDILIMDLANTTTLLHEAICLVNDEDIANIGIIYFNKKKI